MSLAQKFIEATEAKPILREEAPQLYAALDDIAKNAGIDIPTIHLIPYEPHPHPLINAIRRSPNAASLSRKDIAITQPMVDIFHSKNLQRPITDEFKAILAHEMHHCANRTSALVMSRGPVLAVPAIALTAMYLYDRAKEKAAKEKDESPENVSKHVNETASEIRDSLSEPVSQSGFMKGLLNTAKYLAITVAGGAAGLWVARYGARYHEYAADAFAASHFADKEVMVRALRKFHQAVGMSVSEHHQAEKFQRGLIGLLNETVLNHPSYAERVANIRHGSPSSAYHTPMALSPA